MNGKSSPLIVFLLFCLSSCVTQSISPESASSPKTVLSGGKAIPVTKPWRGFNLLGHFILEWNNGGYAESDFILIHELKFNFVRLPMDYRFYTDKQDWNSFSEPALQGLDQAIIWGQKYGIHVSLNLHRAPGYCVNPASGKLPAGQEVSLWTDAGAQSAFIRHWAMFAKRYKGVPAEYLSFNLVNEPPDMGGAVYAGIMRRAIEAIWAIDKTRPVLVDGTRWATLPVEELTDLDIIQVFHDYNPFTVTHYKADWVEGSDSWPVPTWPIVPVTPYLYGPDKGDLHSALTVTGTFPAGTKITFRLNQVSARSRVLISGDKDVVLDRLFVPGAGTGEWEKEVYSKEWKIYQNVYNRDYTAILASPVSRITITNEEGDWCTFSLIAFEHPTLGTGRVELKPGLTDWGLPQAAFGITKAGAVELKSAPRGFEKQYAGDAFFAPWKEFLKKGGKAFVGEMGVYRFTPHGVTLRYLADQLSTLKEMGLGWAFWEFRGTFGPFSSDRTDVQYEAYKGLKLDREMLDLLQKY
jgi:hypothetical protein